MTEAYCPNCMTTTMFTISSNQEKNIFEAKCIECGYLCDEDEFSVIEQEYDNDDDDDLDDDEIDGEKEEDD